VTTAEIRAAIVATLQAISGMGVVHNYERYAKDDKAFRLLYAAGDRVQGWNVRRVARHESSPCLGRWLVTQEWRIAGWRSLADAEASELAFDDLIDAAMDAFRNDSTLGGVVETTVLGDGADDPAGLQLIESGPVMFCGVLCHGARLSLFTRHSL